MLADPAGCTYSLHLSCVKCSAEMFHYSKHRCLNGISANISIKQHHDIVLNECMVSSRLLTPGSHCFKCVQLNTAWPPGMAVLGPPQASVGGKPMWVCLSVSEVQYNIVQCSIVQYSTIKVTKHKLQYIILWYSIVHYIIISYQSICALGFQVATGAVIYIVICYCMLCYVIVCYVIVCYVVLCYVMICYDIICYVMLCLL